MIFGKRNETAQFTTNFSAAIGQLWTPRQAVYRPNKPLPKKKHENKQKATQDVSKSPKGRLRISKSAIGAASKITSKTNVKPENRKKKKKNDLWLQYPDGNWQGRESLRSRAGGIFVFFFFPNWPPTQD